VESRWRPENQAKLVTVLTDHAVPAQVMADEGKTGEAPTVNSKKLKLKADASSMMVNNATVVATDLAGSFREPSGKLSGSGREAGGTVRGRRGGGIAVRLRRRPGRGRAGGHLGGWKTAAP
jgi:hypothetical protein